MPLSEHEQRILEEIEKRLAEEDPRLVEQVGRTDLYTHLARRIRFAGPDVLRRRAAAAAVRRVAVGAAVGFVIMVLSALLIYRYLGQLGRDQIREMQSSGRLTLTGVIGRIAARFARRQQPPGDDPRG